VVEGSGNGGEVLLRWVRGVGVERLKGKREGGRGSKQRMNDKSASLISTEAFLLNGPIEGALHQIN
jgi:hypothetical protein